MSSVAAWKEILVQPIARDHMVQLYQDDDFLARAITLYLVEGLREETPAVIVTTPAHWKLVREHFGQVGLEASDFEKSGQLTILDATDVLAHFMVGDVPDRTLFRDFMGGIIGQTAARVPHRDVRVFGDMVDLLWRQGKHASALRLEQLWNRLTLDHRFVLFCAYKLNPLDPTVTHREMRGLFQEHSHLIPVDDYERLNHAVEWAMDRILGKSPAASLRTIIAANKGRLPVMPGAQATLIWLQDNLPAVLDQVLPEARRFYDAGHPGGLEGTHR
jgi:hypothetical protein